MIETEISYGEEENSLLTDLILNRPELKKKLILLKVILIIVGIYDLIIGLHNLFSTPTGLNIFCLIIAAIAFFLAFGGEKLLLRRSISKKNRKLNGYAGNVPIKYTFDENECTVSSEMGKGKYDWNAFCAYGEHSHYLWIRLKDTRCILVDLNKLTAEDSTLLKQYCEEHINKSANSL